MMGPEVKTPCLGCGDIITWQPSVPPPEPVCPACGQVHLVNFRQNHESTRFEDELIWFFEKKPAPEPIDWDNPPWKAKRKKRPGRNRKPAV